MYKIIRAVLFQFDAEQVHYFSMNCLRLLCRIDFFKKIIRIKFQPTGNTEFSIFDINFSNRLGLGAGFDKNAKYLNELEALGFGFVEIGTVTPLPQNGNAKPRLFRLPKDRALINRMGFNNDGVKIVAERLRKWRNEINHHQLATRDPQLIIGGNIGKNKSTVNEDAWKDYEICFHELHDCVDYFVVNVSSPNTPGLRELQEKDSLAKILKNIQSINKEKKYPKPILLKIAPDLSREQVDDVIDLSLEIKLDGLIVSNTTISRNDLQTSSKAIEKIGAGGLSGSPLKEKSTELIKYIGLKTNHTIAIIGSGGILNGKDAAEKINAGASLVQVWTGFIYGGPAIVKNISSYLTSNKK